MFGRNFFSWSSVGIPVSHRSCGGKALGIGLPSLAALSSLIWGQLCLWKIDVIDNMLLRIWRICYWCIIGVWGKGAPGVTISSSLVVGVLIINSVGLTVKWHFGHTVCVPWVLATGTAVLEDFTTYVTSSGSKFTTTWWHWDYNFSVPQNLPFESIDLFFV